MPTRIITMLIANNKGSLSCNCFSQVIYYLFRSRFIFTIILDGFTCLIWFNETIKFNLIDIIMFDSSILYPRE